MKNFLAQLVGDGRGGADEQALISLIGAGVFFGLQVYAVVVRGQAFDPMAFGTGFGTLLGATAAGFWPARASDTQPNILNEGG